MAIILSRPWLISLMLHRIDLFQVFSDSGWWCFNFCLSVNWIIQSRWWIRISFELVFASHCHFLRQSSKWRMWIVLSSFRILIYHRLRSSGRTLPVRCRLWPALTISCFRIIVPRRWIWIRLKLVLAPYGHLLRKVPEIFVRVIATWLRSGLNLWCLFAIFYKGLIWLWAHLFDCILRLVLTGSRIFIRIKLVFIAKTDILKATSKRFGKVMSSRPKMRLLLLLPYLPHLPETDHLHSLLALRFPRKPRSLRLLRLLTLGIGRLII